MGKLELYLEECTEYGKTEWEAIVVAFHCLMHGLGFVLTKVGEEDVQENSVTLPEGWNRNGDVFSLYYKHPRSSFRFSIKCLVMGSKLLIHCQNMTTEEVFSTEISVKEYVQKEENEGTISFRSYKMIDSLEKVFRERLIKGINPQNTEELREARGNRSEREVSEEQRREQSLPPPAPSRLLEEQDRRPLFGIGVGESDLYPGGFRGNFSGGVVGPSHPMFGNIRPEFARPSNAPPGARFDPFGPPGVGIPGAPFRGGRGRGSNFGPDPDHFPPPPFEDEEDGNPYWM